MVAVSAGVWLYGQYYSADYMTLADGTRVRDFSVYEAGEFAGPEYEQLRRSHFERRQAIRRSEAVSLNEPSPEAVARVLEPIVRRAIRDNDAARAAIASAAGGRGDVEEIESELAGVVARAASVMAGAEMEDYLAAVPAEFAIEEPDTTNPVDHTAEEFATDLDVPADGAPPAAWRAVFGRMYGIPRVYRDGDFLVRRIFSDPGALLVAVIRHEDAHGAFPAVKLQYGERAQNLYLRTSSQAHPVFHRLTSGRLNREDKHPDLLDAVVVLGVEDAGGDAYPMVLDLEFDPGGPAGSRWRLKHVSRRASPRALVAPFFVF